MCQPRNRNVPGRAPWWILLSLVCAWAVTAVAETAPAAALKAGFIVSFARFTAWPADAPPSRAPRRLCVLGDAKVAKALDKASRGKVVGDREAIVSQPELETFGASCDLVYASGLARKEVALVLTAVRGAPVLTVSDSHGFARIGGMVELYEEAGELYEEAGRLRFAINRHDVERSRLKMSSKVLSLATLIRDGE